MNELTVIQRTPTFEDLVDIRTVKLRDGAARIENAMYFLEQIKNPHMFRVGDDIAIPF